MSEPRRHHLVPQHHLRRFADDRDQVMVASREDLAKRFPSSVANVPVERDFYAIATSQGWAQDVERMFGAIENAAKPAFDRLLTGTFPPDPETRWTIATFIAAQWTRGWDIREAMNLFWQHNATMLMLNATRASVRKVLGEKEGREPSDEEVDDLVAFARDPSQYTVEIHQNQPIKQTVEMIPGLSNLVAARSWQLLRSNSGARFATSDAPVSTWTAPKNQHPSYGSGFGICDELAFAIDRRHALVFAREAPAGEIVRDVGDDHVRALNRRTAASARRFVIFHPADDPLSGIDLPPPQPKISISPAPTRFVPDGA